MQASYLVGILLVILTRPILISVDPCQPVRTEVKRDVSVAVAIQAFHGKTYARSLQHPGD